MNPKKTLTFCIAGKKVNCTSLRNAITTPEIFIIILVAATMAALAAPRFGQAREQSKLTRLVRSLEIVRQQIELYTVQHKGLFPGQKEKNGRITEEDFIKALTQSDGVYGPYLKKFPANPFNNLDSVRIGTVTLGSAAGAGWFFNSVTGDFRADDLEFHQAY